MRGGEQGSQVLQQEPFPARSNVKTQRGGKGHRQNTELYSCMHVAEEKDWLDVSYCRVGYKEPGAKHNMQKAYPLPFILVSYLTFFLANLTGKNVTERGKEKSQILSLTQGREFRITRNLDTRESDTLKGREKEIVLTFSQDPYKERSTPTFHSWNIYIHIHIYMCVYILVSHHYIGVNKIWQKRT